MRLGTIITRGLKTVALHLPAPRPRAALLPLLALALGSQAWAQNTITFTADVTTGIEVVTPVLTWSTAPPADECTASGDWSGLKGPQGTETLAPISSGATYNISCEWLDSAATLTWTAPTQNTDGTPLTDLAGFRVKYGQAQGGPYPQVDDIAIPTATTHVVGSLGSGNWFFVSTAYNAIGTESDVSNEVMKVLGLISIVESVGITVMPRPSPPSGLGVQ